jgi:hypothetical protein
MPMILGMQRVVADGNGTAPPTSAPADDGSTTAPAGTDATVAPPAAASPSDGSTPSADGSTPAPPSSPTDSTDILSDGVQFIRFRYYDGTQWLTTWSDTNPPLAVEVALGDTALPDGTDPMEYAGEVTIRVIAIPSGKAAAPTTQPDGTNTNTPAGGTQNTAGGLQNGTGINAGYGGGQ